MAPAGKSLWLTASMAFVALLAAVVPVRAYANTVCTLITDIATGAILVEDGECRARVTPASTFKIPLAVMGFDNGFLTDAHAPVLSFRKGDPDWGGANWRRDTDPSDWLRYSVVWYSQRITHALGARALRQYAESFQYGNADFSGDPGEDNGLERAWIASSLQVSPLEQVRFWEKLIQSRLPVSDAAMTQTRAIIGSWEKGSWTLHGKTGSAYPRRADRSFDYAHGWGWFVGWGEHDGRVLAFARLTQASQRRKGSEGNRAQDALLAEWPTLMARIGNGAP